MKLITLLLVSFLGLYGCQTPPASSAGGSRQDAATTITYSGRTNADAILRADTTRMIIILAASEGCKAIENITIKVISYEPSNGTTGHVWGKEEWLATGCGRTFPYNVTFTEDGNGGSYYSIAEE